MNCNPCCGCFPPITTYNPSVADNFPTILQQVEYLKALLKKYPSQQFFVSVDVVTKDTIKITTIKNDDNRQINAGDFIFAHTQAVGTLPGDILMFSYTGTKDVNGNYIVDYVGTFGASNEDIHAIRSKVEQIATEVNTKQDKLNDKSDVTVAWLAANGVNAGTVKAGDMSDGEDNIYKFPKKAGTFALTSDVGAVETKAQQALDLATTNETDIATLDGQVAELETKTQILPDEKPTYQMVLCINPNNKIFFIPFTASILKNAFPNFDNNGRLHSTNGADESDDTAVATMYEITALRQEVISRIGAQQFKTLFGNQSIVGEGNIDLYKHHINLNIVGKSLSGNLYIDIISSNSLKCDSLTDIKTLLGQTFKINCFGELLIDAAIFKYAVFATETQIVLNDASSVSWTEISTITDTVTTI